MNIPRIFVILLIFCTGCAEDGMKAVLSQPIPTHKLIVAKSRAAVLSAESDSGASVASPSESDLFYNINGLRVIVVADTYFMTNYASLATSALYYRAFSSEEARRMLSIISHKNPEEDREGILYITENNLLHVVVMSEYKFQCNLHPHIWDIQPNMCPICNFPMTFVFDKVNNEQKK